MQSIVEIVALGMSWVLCVFFFGEATGVRFLLCRLPIDQV